jgi:hypothetical protein
MGVGLRYRQVTCYDVSPITNACTALRRVHASQHLWWYIWWVMQVTCAAAGAAGQVFHTAMSDLYVQCKVGTV